MNRIVSDRAINAKPQDFSLSESHRTKLSEHLIKIHKPYIATNISDRKLYSKESLVKILPKVEQKTSEYIVTEKTKPETALGIIAEAVLSTFFAESNFKHACRKCKSDKLEIRFGKNYYFKCLSCDENNRIDATCPKCKSILKIRKDKKQFFAECSACKASELFHLNS